MILQLVKMHWVSMVIMLRHLSQKTKCSLPYKELYDMLVKTLIENYAI